MMDLWPACRETIHIGSLGGELLRMVESQQQIATTSLVDDLAEQALLEELIERSKPPLRPGTERLHDLLATPFRYPPLRHGSRFGTRFEPSLLYGARGLPTLLAEVAYYRFVLWTGMEVPPPSGRLLTQHTQFRASWRSERAVRLQAPPCSSITRASTCWLKPFRSICSADGSIRTSPRKNGRWCVDDESVSRSAMVDPGFLVT
jgi:hypothetical protein